MSVNQVVLLSSCTELQEWINKQEKTSCIRITEKVTLNDLVKLDPYLIISYGYRHILKKNIVDNFKNKIINLHISFLPWNRGADPNFWSFLENTPKGVTIHIIDNGIDTGDILFQKMLTFNDGHETLSSTYSILQYEILKLFKDNWHSIANLDFKPIPQKKTSGSFHRKKDFRELSFLVKKQGWNTNINQLKQDYIRYLKSNE